MPALPPESAADGHAWPTLILAIVVAVTLAVGGLWLVAVTGAAWALVLAMVLVLVGVVGLLTVITALLDDEASS